MEVINREMSWLLFNERVLQEAEDDTVPLLQRLRFLGIFSNNQDEFVKVRLANLLRMQEIRSIKNIKTVEGFPVTEILEKINERIKATDASFVRTYTNILQEMETHHIYVRNEKQLTVKQKNFCRDYFSREISPLIVPLLVRKSTKIPFLSDQYIYHAVKMVSCQNKHDKYAIIRIPVSKNCPRFIVLPSTRSKKEIIFIDDIIRLCLKEIFFMFKCDTLSAFTFKLIRDANLTVDDDITKSLMEKMEEGLTGRLHGSPVRLMYDKDMPADLLSILTTKLKLDTFKIQPGGRYHMLKHLTDFPAIDPALEYENLPPLRHPDIQPFTSIFQVMDEKDIFLNFPYHTFDHVIDLLREAAIDPKVSRICITLYRTADRSKIINVLINAAENGKDVLVVEELMARFDEEKNMENSDQMQKAGIKVIHGIKGLKVHSKLIYIEKKDKRGIKAYTYVGTGNFNETTARIYTDFGLLTSHPVVGKDSAAVFEFLLNPHKHGSYKMLTVSPYHMRNRFVELIENEIKNKKKGKKACIYAKFNSLTDMGMIKRLYKASQAGVEIKLIIRGACCLIPGQPVESENIEAISIVDKYLEHGRLVAFHNNGEEIVYILSADWMTRNLDNRLEVGVPIQDKNIVQNIREIFDIQWSDNVKARDLSYTTENRYHRGDETESRRSQTLLYNYYKHTKK